MANAKSAVIPPTEAIDWKSGPLWAEAGAIGYGRVIATLRGAM